MRRLATLLGVLLVPVMWLGAEPAVACSCVIRDTPQLVAAADAVVVGTLTDRHRDGQALVYTVTDAQALKGDVGTTAEVRTAAQGTMCGLVGLAADRRYVLYLVDDADGWSASSCGGTTRATPAALAEVEAATGGRPEVHVPIGRPDVAQVLMNELLALGAWWR